MIPARWYHRLALGLVALLSTLASALAQVPVITPVSSVRQVITSGNTLTLTVTATGSPTYKWRRNGIDLVNGGSISGATTASLAITSTSPLSHSGWYQLLATNLSGTTTSATFFVTVTPSQTQIIAWGYNAHGECMLPAGLAGVTAVSAGYFHTLALKSDGTVAVWGDNNYQQLNLPVGLTNVVAISAGYYHSLALKSDGTVVAWGDNTYGQCAVPAGLTNVVAISAGFGHSLALKSDGTVVAWGRNSEGQAPTSGLPTTATAISAGYFHSIALKSDNTVVAWGSNTYGQAPASVGLTNVTAISAGYYHNLALKSDNTVSAWGAGTTNTGTNNNYGQSIIPGGATSVVAISAGGYHSTALKSDGSVVPWGAGTTNTGSFPNYGQSIVPGALATVFGLSAGWGNTVTLRNASPLYYWPPAITNAPSSRQTPLFGQNFSLNVFVTGSPAPTLQWRRNGRNLSDGNGISGSTTSSLSFTGASPAAHNGWYELVASNGGGVATAEIYVNVVVNPAQIIGWGANYDGQSVAPANATSTVGATAMAGGDGHSISLKGDGTLVPWGMFYNGSTNIAATAPVATNVVGVAAGGNETVAFTATGTVAAAGYYFNGSAYVTAATGMPAITNAVSAAVGDNCALVVSRSNNQQGTVSAWGTYYNGTSYVAVSNSTFSSVTNAASVAAGGAQMLIVKTDGTIAVSGTCTTNGGQTYVTAASLVPAALTSGSPNIVSAALGHNHGVALKADGTVAAWGTCYLSTEGQYASAASLVPAALTNANTAHVVAVVAGGDYALALKSDGTAVGWGDGAGTAGASGLTGILGLASGSGHVLVLRSATNGNLPVITVQPPSNPGVNAGGTIGFSVTATGADTFQWQVDGVDIPGANGSTYTTPNTVPQDDGNVYTVEVSNSAGTVTAGPTVLIILPPDPSQTITFPDPGPQQYGAVVALTATASSYMPVTYSIDSGPGTINGSTLTITGVGTVVVRAKQPGYTSPPPENQLFYNPATDVVRSITVSKKTLTVTANDKTKVYGAANPTLTASISGLVNGDTAAVVSGAPVLSTTATTGSSPGNYPITISAGTLAAANYTFAFVNGTLSVTKAVPVITWPTPTPIVSGTALSSIQLNATANVAGTFVYNPAAGAVLSTGTQTLGVTFNPTDTTNYVSTTAQRSLTVLPVGFPVFTLQPASQYVIAHRTATFTAAATGNPAPTYQWRKNGANIPGATSATYAIPNVGFADAATYTVVATNSLGAATSASATLNITSGQGDFNADGQPDLLWQNTGTGQRSVWLMNGLTATGGVDLGTVPVEWVIAGTGDFTGDGKTDLLWQNTVTGQRSVWAMNGTTAMYGIDLGTVPLDWWIAGVGDFNADGQPDILWTNTSTNERAIWLMNGTTAISGVSLGIIPFEWTIAGAADFNLDGKTDILWSNVLTGERSVWLMNGTNATAGISLGFFTPRLQISGTGDYNGDGYADILLSDQVSGARSVWLMSGTTIASTASLATVSPDWILNRPVPRHVPVDFNADSKSDIVWQNTITGERSAWLMNGTTPLSGISLGTRSTDWQIVATGDFNFDGRADLVWQNTATGECNIWLMNGGTKLSEVALPTIPVVWKFRATGDFNLDGAVDLVLQNTTTGECVVWLMNGATPTGGVSLGIQPLTMQIVGCGDFNADSKADLVWTNTSTGERSIWLMNGTTMASNVSLGVVPLQWAISGTGDFDQDGNADLVWQNTATGERSIWLMNGTSPRSGVSLGTAPTYWSIRN